MNRLAQFFLTMMLRAAIVFTVTMWGVTRIYAVKLAHNFDRGSCGVACMPEGICAALMPETDPLVFAIADAADVASWGLGGPAEHHSLLGWHVWHHRSHTVQIGVTWPAALIYLLVVYAAVRMLRQRRRRKRPQAAATVRRSRS